ncbi:MAG: hypothetical protein IJ473_01890 [Alphaproteobacteria bacterium]|nr:hypothetical protein [Alphaproteobacteria bacterium]
MKPILVHCHIYYTNLYEELETCIKNITVPFELYITMVEKNISLINKINKSFPNAKIEIVENRGFDIAPFIHILNKVNLNNYSYIIKLHTKRDINEYVFYNYHNLSNNHWRKYLLSFISSKKNFEKTISILSKNKNIGMCSNYKVICSKTKFKKIKSKIDEIFKKLNLTLKTKKYVCGTMFIAKSELFIPIQKLNLSIYDFEKPLNHNDGTLAHIFERIFGYIIYAQNYTIKDVITPKLKQIIDFEFITILFNLKFWKELLYQKKITSSGKTIIKILKIPVYNKKRS